jgi:hypothetical protein
MYPGKIAVPPGGGGIVLNENPEPGKVREEEKAGSVC